MSEQMTIPLPPSDVSLLAGVMVHQATGKLTVWAAPGIDAEGLFLDGLKALWELRVQQQQQQQSQIIVPHGPIPGM